MTALNYALFCLTSGGLCIGTAKMNRQWVCVSRCLCVSVFTKLQVSSSTNIRWCIRLHKENTTKFSAPGNAIYLGHSKHSAHSFRVTSTLERWTLSVRCFSLLVSHPNGTCRQPSRSLDDASSLNLCTIPQSIVGRSDSETVRQTETLKDWKTEILTLYRHPAGNWCDSIWQA